MLASENKLSSWPCCDSRTWKAEAGQRVGQPGLQSESLAQKTSQPTPILPTPQTCNMLGIVLPTTGFWKNPEKLSD
jgi:hypothetical protein